MDTWQTVLLAFGGNAALLAVLGVLGKSLLEKMIVRDTKIFESQLNRDAKIFETQLKATTDSEIERLKIELARSVESYKVQLRKSEIFFQRELDAASAFSSILNSILPVHINPTLHWHQAKDSIARNYEKIENRLGDFSSKHAAVLTDDEISLLSRARSLIGRGSLFVSESDEVLDPLATESAAQFYLTLRQLDTKIMTRVRAQTSL